MATLPSPEFLALQEALAGHYSLDRELGRGGMGIVYLAREVRLDRPVALKLLPAGLAERPELRDQFLREARTAARLSHPHIVPIHAVHEFGAFVLFAMAYVEGETLGERVRGRGPLPPRDAARILREVAWALGYAHAQGVIHHDVKPDNILLEAGSGRALVTDFGIAHRSADPARIGTDEVVGTAEFMSPEQASGAAVDERSDLYALGVVGYYLLSGRLPFQGDSAAATLVKHLTEPPVPLAAVAPGIPTSLAQAIDRCLAKDPEERFPNGGALAEALSRSLEERREVPMALRLFLKQNRESTAPIAAMALFAGGSIFVWGTLFALDMVDFEWVILLVPTAVWLALISTPAVVLVQMARRLLRAGYDHGDLVRAMRAEIEERQGDLASTYGSEPSRLDRWLKRLLAGGLGTHLAGIGWMLLGPYHGAVEAILGPLLGVSLATWVGAGSVAAGRHQLRGHVPGQGWLKFWKSALGRGVFRASRFRLGELPTGASYGPTELAIGLAVDRLFEALPPQQRESFRELPDVVRRLEADAVKMREHIKQLETVGRESAPGDVVAARIDGTRQAAEDRLREVAAALEAIRVGLLRLHVGAGSTASVTTDLGAARVLSEDIARTLEGAREVEGFLGRPAGRDPVISPTPA
ncbi:MAG: serine/threonine-protein kinase [Gemmatimonadales bacterium]